jgi:hypothetical protein
MPQGSLKFATATGYVELSHWANQGSSYNRLSGLCGLQDRSSGIEGPFLIFVVSRLTFLFQLLVTNNPSPTSICISLDTTRKVGPMLQTQGLL